MTRMWGCRTNESWHLAKVRAKEWPSLLGSSACLAPALMALQLVAPCVMMQLRCQHRENTHSTWHHTDRLAAHLERQRFANQELSESCHQAVSRAASAKTHKALSSLHNAAAVGLRMVEEPCKRPYRDSGMRCRRSQLSLRLGICLCRTLCTAAVSGATHAAASLASAGRAFAGFKRSNSACSCLGAVRLQQTRHMEATASAAQKTDETDMPSQTHKPAEKNIQYALGLRQAPQV